jgi:hypothetical protein
MGPFYQDFCQFLNNLDDFQIAMRMYTLADKAISQVILYTLADKATSYR